MSLEQIKHKITCKEGKDAKEYLDRATSVLTKAFLGDPTYTWLLHDHPSSHVEPVLYKFMHGIFTAATLNSGVFVEVDSFGCCGVLMPPGYRADNPRTWLQAGLIQSLFTVGVKGFKRAIFDFAPVEEMKAKALTKDELKKHWYVFIMGTVPEKQRQGLGGEMLLYMQERARSDGRALWLEATTPSSRELYLRYGFKDVGEVVLGKGKVGKDGKTEKGGEGITMWSMVWRS
ncbi:hypothetical protein B0H66DRAFT_570237 [Apodospora peruviana]|uniref:N-acetyltransferase domain-containing protein n=1 Tax=Apodospora peruviana TaxID=516989 RepID=A0AAE0HSS0_9PEZI|nr:hypothetical protein B0H66DRAFT_570237 [Apodospora peruviana]